jgi:hypothetical protein
MAHNALFCFASAMRLKFATSFIAFQLTFLALNGLFGRNILFLIKVVNIQLII